MISNFRRETLGRFAVLDADDRIVGSFDHVEEACAGLRLLPGGSIVRVSDWTTLQTRARHVKRVREDSLPVRRRFDATGN